ncbi:MAG: hypothetical protein E7334_09740 [Clostridiales bacterium]|nr:hypothetical protein [Clostridiales bacterium]
MFSKVFLAMTAREMENPLPNRVAYMACHFSPYGTGLSNAPLQLPKNSILLLDDSTPVENHDPDLVIQHLRELVDQFSLQAVLLDFQGNKNRQTADMAAAICSALPCPVAVSERYADNLDCPVFLSPAPANVSLQNHLSPWLDRGVYLEIAPGGLQITVTEQHNTSVPLPAGVIPTLSQQDEHLHCHYHIEVFPDRAVFTLHRAKEDLAVLADEAYSLGVRGTVGLYQELNWL